MPKREAKFTTIALSYDTKWLLMDLRYKLFELTGRDWKYDQILNLMLRLFSDDFLTEVRKREKG